MKNFRNDRVCGGHLSDTRRLDFIALSHYDCNGS